MAETRTLPPRRSALVSALKPGTFGTLGSDGPGSDGPGVTLSERHPMSVVQVEGRIGQEAALGDALETAIGIHPADGFNRVSGDEDGPRILWVGPCRWYVAEPESRDLYGALRPAMGKFGGATVDLSSGRTVFRLSGHDARRVLAKGCSLDTHSSTFGPGACGQTGLFHVSVLIACVDEAPTYEIYAARGYALSLWESLVDASMEYGLRVD
ncbi:MAG: hypothetical protein HOH65_20320 [Rhodospirillaceae bacterium]|nr:hypothetical protein [Rhodospirillaceae bacterium]